MGDEKEQEHRFWLKLLATLITGVALPAAIYFASQAYTQQKDQADQQQRQLDRVSNLIKSLASDSARERGIAIAYIRYLGESKQAPAELIPVLEHIVAADPNSPEARDAGAVIGVVANNQRDQATEKAVQSLPTLIYIQISKEIQRHQAQGIADKLSAHGWKVPGIELRPTDNTELRYFRDSDRSMADQIASALKELGVTAKVANLADYLKQSNRTVRPNQFELWFGPGALP